MITAEQMKDHFDGVALKMSDLPVFNADLAVACVGFEQPDKKAIDDYAVGVLITPWCMNLVLLPLTDSFTRNKNSFDKEQGDKQLITLPSGVYEFIHVNDDQLGRYLSCSLFSPMFEFASQEQALDTSLAVLTEVVCEKNISLTDLQQAKKELDVDQTVSSVEVERPRRSKEALSRRGFLTAGLSNGEAPK